MCIYKTGERRRLTCDDQWRTVIVPRRHERTELHDTRRLMDHERRQRCYGERRNSNSSSYRYSKYYVYDTIGLPQGSYGNG